MKIHVLMLAKTFPATHPRAGKPTNFYFKIEALEKLHTIRANYQLWEKRIAEVNKGDAIISLREWTGKPYNSPQRELRQFGKGEIGLQKIILWDKDAPIGEHSIEKSANCFTSIPEYVVSENDGLFLHNFKAWFKNADTSKPYAVIHFTDFRY